MDWRTMIILAISMRAVAPDKLGDLLGSYLPPSNSFDEGQPKDIFHGMSFALPAGELDSPEDHNKSPELRPHHINQPQVPLIGGLPAINTLPLSENHPIEVGISKQQSEHIFSPDVSHFNYNGNSQILKDSRGQEMICIPLNTPGINVPHKPEILIEGPNIFKPGIPKQNTNTIFPPRNNNVNLGNNGPITDFKSPEDSSNESSGQFFSPEVSFEHDDQSRESPPFKPFKHSNPPSVSRVNVNIPSTFRPTDNNFNNKISVTKQVKTVPGRPDRPPFKNNKIFEVVKDVSDEIGSDERFTPSKNALPKKPPVFTNNVKFTPNDKFRPIPVRPSGKLDSSDSPNSKENGDDKFGASIFVKLPERGKNVNSVNPFKSVDSSIPIRLPPSGNQRLPKPHHEINNRVQGKTSQVKSIPPFRNPINVIQPSVQREFPNTKVIQKSNNRNKIKSPAKIFTTTKQIFEAEDDSDEVHEAKATFQKSPKVFSKAPKVANSTPIKKVLSKTTSFRPASKSRPRPIRPPVFNQPIEPVSKSTNKITRPVSNKFNGQFHSPQKPKTGNIKNTFVAAISGQDDSSENIRSNIFDQSIQPRPFPPIQITKNRFESSFSSVDDSREIDEGPDVFIKTIQGSEEEINRFPTRPKSIITNQIPNTPTIYGVTHTTNKKDGSLEISQESNLVPNPKGVVTTVTNPLFPKTEKTYNEIIVDGQPSDISSESPKKKDGIRRGTLLLSEPQLPPPSPGGAIPAGKSTDPDPSKSMKKMMMPYGFRWKVNDDKTGNAFGQTAESDGMVERGRYHVLLPDGRRQVVTYLADWETGYHVDVKYEDGSKPFSEES